MVFYTDLWESFHNRALPILKYVQLSDFPSPFYFQGHVHKATRFDSHSDDFKKGESDLQETA